MPVFLTVLNVITPIFLLASIGFIWVKTGLDYPVQFITKFAMSLTVPALVFTALMNSKVDVYDVNYLALATCLAYALITAVFWGVLRVMRLDMRTYLAPLIVGNTGNLGLPLALFAFGQDGLGLAIVVFAIMATYSFTFGVWMVSNISNPLIVIRQPIVVAAILGSVFFVMDWHTPMVITRTLTLIGNMAIPMMLITLGVAIARLKINTWKQAVWLSLMKAGICATIAFGVGIWFALPPVSLAVLVLQLSTPVAVTNYLLAEKYGADSQAVAGLVVVSTACSVIILSVLLAVFI